MSNLVNPLQLGLPKPEKPLSPHLAPAFEKIPANPRLELQAHFWDSPGKLKEKEEKHGNVDDRNSRV